MEKIKSFLNSEKGQNLLIILIIILVGIGAFLLGRLSKLNDSKSIKIEYKGGEEASGIKALAIDALPNLASPSGDFFASKNGKKYYSTNCSAGANIKVSNRVYFKTREQAENAGYELSSSCR